MRCLLLLIIACLLPSLVQAYDVLVLQSSRATAYEEVVNGFRRGESVSARVIVLADYSEVDVVRMVREDRPRLVLAVGDAAVMASRQIRNLPVVAVMSLGINISKPSNLTGISMFVQPERYVSMFNSLNIRRVGLIYSEEKSGWYLRLAQKVTSDAGIDLVVRKISTTRETLEKMSTLAGKVDALWMLPDTTAVTRETAEAYFSFGLQNSIPVISFATAYLRLGAASVLEIDRVAMGRQASAMTLELLKTGTRDYGNMTFRFPEKIDRKNNPAVLKKLAMPHENLPLTHSDRLIFSSISKLPLLH